MVRCAPVPDKRDRQSGAFCIYAISHSKAAHGSGSAGENSNGTTFLRP